MQLISRKCGICANWYRPSAHHEHCPVCGSHPITFGNRTMYFNPVTMRKVVSVSPKTIPSVFFHSDSHSQQLTLRQKKV
jgi:hypothetical protein